MISRRKKKALRLLAALNTKKPDATPGRLVGTKRGYASVKDRRASGWKTPRLSKSKVKYSEVIAEAIEPEKFYDEWCSLRDGFRHNTSTDQLYHRERCSGIHKEDIVIQNKKIKKQIKIREAKLQNKNES